MLMLVLFLLWLFATTLITLQNILVNEKLGDCVNRSHIGDQNAVSGSLLRLQKCYTHIKFPITTSWKVFGSRFHV